MRKPNILFTGFGPFPGVPVNVSGALVHALGPVASARFPDFAFHGDVLATEWRSAPERIGQLYADLKPVLALHFGVARDARGLRLERVARNACRLDLDATGMLPSDPWLVESGETTEAARLPLDAIHRRLTARDVPVAFSDDAGDYLCNAVLYHALALARGQERPGRVGFIHLPEDLDHPPLSFSGALEACLEIIDVALSDGS